ncbi:MAG TPA: hypothetical protein PLB35_08165 [Myxococcota bacterium]|nr:hypothetical protein [Myxococcota bacterium]HOH77215.1 hypothetical protein [Myxococcota bacterium]
MLQIVRRHGREELFGETAVRLFGEVPTMDEIFQELERLEVDINGESGR